MKRLRFVSFFVCVLVGFAARTHGAEPSPLLIERQRVSDGFKQLTRAAKWSLVESRPIQFPTFHPQGMVKIGAEFFVSSVEVTRRPRTYPVPQQGFDRDAGAGTGHLFKIDAQGRLLADLVLGEGTIYHPGGIDFDGRDIWVPVAEYRPNSRSIIYRVNPATMKATEIFRFPDHLGGLVHNTERRTLHGVSWGSRYFYRWTLDEAGRVTDATAAPEKLRTANPSFYIDYQDCKFLGRDEMLCGGLAQIGDTVRLGGLELVDLRTHRPIWQLPLPLWTKSGLPMTQNPCWIEPTEGGLRAYFMPEDDRATLYVFEVKP
ncbi:MAG: hypothetical protein HZA93_02770 [Verrucomicrobia bacterium]|nr:hypothetical protein [Verrucomicrobiota bacterium]